MQPNNNRSQIDAVNNAVPKGPELNIKNAKSIDGLGSDYAKRNRDYRKSQEDRIYRQNHTIMHRIMGILPIFVMIAFVLMLIMGFMTGFKKHF